MLASAFSSRPNQKYAEHQRTVAAMDIDYVYNFFVTATRIGALSYTRSDIKMQQDPLRIGETPPWVSLKLAQPRRDRM